MGKCIYCKKKAGFLRRKHKECKNNHANALESIKNLIETTFVTTGDFKKLSKEISMLVKSGHVSEKELNEIYLEKYDIAVQQFLYDGFLSKEEENKLIAFKDTLHIRSNVLDENWFFEEFMKILIIKILAEKKPIPKHFYTENNENINIDENENILRLFNDAEAYKGEASEENINKDWFTTTVFDEPLATKKGMKYMGKWILVISEKNIYFTKENDLIEISIKDIEWITPYEDGVGIQTKKNNRTFKNIDWRFSYSIIYNLHR